jgi:8-oxo-dGTP pyrophosphatase MutT (NUDIX family)
MVAKHGTPEEQEQVRRAVYAKYPGIANRAKQADYRDRATLLLHNGQGGVLAAKNQHPENPIYPPFFFPGGGVFKEEGIRNSITEEEIQEGLRREALEEIGHKLKNIDSLGMQPLEVNMGDAWTARQLAKKGVPYKGFREHIRAAMSDGIDNSILGSEGDDFTAYNPEYINANELASALESSLPGLRKAGDPTLVTSRLQTIEALKRLSNTKQADYRDRATLILHDNKGNVFAAPDVDGGTEAPYFFPGGGVYEDEGLFPVPDNKLIEEGLRREALEELGYKIKDIQDFGFEPTEIDKGRGWQNRVLAKRGVPYKGYREHLRAAIMDGVDESSYGSAGDSFHTWYPEYTPADEVASAIEKHTNKNKYNLHPSEYTSRMKQVDFIRRLGNVKTSEEKRYRPKVQGLLYTPDLKVLASKSQGAGSGLREFANYKFPGGGIEPGESLIDAAKKELLEETGYTTSSDPFEFGMPATTVDWDEAFRQQALKKGRDFHGEISHFLAAPVGARDLSLHGKEGDELLGADFIPIDSLIADLEHTSKLPDNEYAVFDKTKLDAARKFKEHMAKKAYYIGRRLAIKSFVSDS